VLESFQVEAKKTMARTINASEFEWRGKHGTARTSDIGPHWLRPNLDETRLGVEVVSPRTGRTLWFDEVRCTAAGCHVLRDAEGLGITLTIITA
jgi:hypothetical protein